METIKLYNTVTLFKHKDGSFSYTDTYGELHKFANSTELWEYLAEDGEEWSDEIKSFILGYRTVL